jgi:hypothetical protein
MRSSVCLLVLAFAVGCGGAGNVGEACETPGRADDCVDGAICVTNPSDEGDPSDPVWDTYSCRIECDHQSDCPSGEECRGVTGAPAARACQPMRAN